jgi:mannose-6-phosphate isomerase-like protein (cupin superfamily)
MGEAKPEALQRRNISPAEMELRVARFSQLKKTPEPFVDSQIEGALRDAYLVIGKGVVEKQSMLSMISDAEDFNITLIKAPPGNGASLHAHDTVEVFVPFTGKWALIWLNGDKREEIVLEPFDLMSMPIGVMRGFRNIGDSDGWLFAITGGTDSGRVHWHPEVIEMSAAHGWYLDAEGNVRRAKTNDRVPQSDTSNARSYMAAVKKWSPQEMLAQRVARFSGLVPNSAAFLDTVLPGHERQHFNVIGTGVTEDRDAQALISDVVDCNVTYMKAGRGQAAAPRRHKTVEVLVSLTGQWELSWGENAEHRLQVGQFDMISVPPGVMHGIRNIGNEDQWLMSVTGSANAGRVEWHPDVVVQAGARGLTLDAAGYLKRR